MRAGGAAAAHAGSRFYLYPRLLSLADDVRACFAEKAELHNLSRTQFLFELDVHDVLRDHPLRVWRRDEAAVFVMPLLAVMSWQAGSCGAAPSASTSHRERMNSTLEVLREEVDFDSGPHILTCTCVMQRSIYTPPLFEHLSSHARSIVTLSHARRGFKSGAASQLSVISPYHSVPAMHAAAGSCAGGGRQQLSVFAGSPETGRLSSTCVRHHILALSRAEPALVSTRFTERKARGGACGATGACVDGFNAGRTHEKAAAGGASLGAKPEMASMMLRSRYCLVPEGDSPESSRLFDAVAALCVPLVITSDEGLLVPHSRAWAGAALVIGEEDFLRMGPAELQAWLTAEGTPERAARRCSALEALRHDMGASRVLSRAVRVASNLTDGFDANRTLADAHVLLPPRVAAPSSDAASAGEGRRAWSPPLPGVGDWVSVYEAHNRSAPWARGRVRSVSSSTGGVVVQARAESGASTNVQVCRDDYALGEGPSGGGRRRRRRRRRARR